MIIASASCSVSPFTLALYSAAVPTHSPVSFLSTLTSNGIRQPPQ
jgi:hypothetical protein